MTGCRCGICNHPDLEKINAELLIGTSYRKIERQWNVSKAALSRHRQHMQVTEQQQKAVQRLKMEEIAATATGDDDVLGQVKGLGLRAKRLLDECQQDRDRKHEIATMKEARELLDLQARLMRLLGPSTAIQINNPVAISYQKSPDYLIILQVLQRHPEIRQELDEALQEAGL